MTYRLHLSPLADYSERRTHVNDGTVQAAASLFDDTNNDEDARLPCNALNFFPRTIASQGGRGHIFAALEPVDGLMWTAQSPLHPIIARTGSIPNSVAEINGALEVVQELFSALARASPDLAAEV